MKRKLFLRERLFKFVRTKIAKTPEGVVSPKWVGIVYRILFPLRYYIENNKHINYDWTRNVYVINGLEFSSVIFTFFANSARVGTVFSFDELENGNITITTFPKHLIKKVDLSVVEIHPEKYTREMFFSTPQEGEFYFLPKEGCWIFREKKWRQAKHYIVKKQTSMQEYPIGTVLLQEGEKLERLQDEKWHFSNGLCLLDERHLIVRPDLFILIY